MNLGENIAFYNISCRFIANVQQFKPIGLSSAQHIDKELFACERASFVIATHLAIH